MTILASQLKDLAGITWAGAEPGSPIPKLAALAGALPTLNPAALGVGIGTAALIFLIRAARPNWPGMLIAVVNAAAIVTPVSFAGGDHRQPFWRAAAWPTDASFAAQGHAGAVASNYARRAFLPRFSAG